MAIVSLLAAGQFSSSSTSPVEPPISPTVMDSTGTTAGLRTVPVRNSVPGYDRDCGPGHGCVFGPAWSDDVDVAGGHQGCDKRIICMA